MGRVRSFLLLCVLTTLVAALAGCGKGASGVAPTTITIAPASLSLEQGKYSGLLVTDSSGAAVTVTRISWQSSDRSALSVAILNGVPTACAGTWNAPASPTVCNPGPAKAVQLTASANGATSPPITVFVHQHIERLAVSPLVSPVPNCGKSSVPGLSAASEFAAAGYADYQVVATNNGNDITSTIGPITWASENNTVATLTTTGTGLLFNQVRATAKTPGQTSFFATAGNATSPPLTFTTCPVVGITLATSTGVNSLVLPRGSPSQTITATVTDLAGLILTSPPITWSTTNPNAASVSATGVIAAAQTGTASVTASCLPTNCNIGFQPAAAPIYPPVAIGVAVTGTATSTTAFAASSGCWDRANGPVLGCLSFLIPIPQTTNVPGAPIALPQTPTSMMMSASGALIYAGSCVPRSAPPALPVCNGISVISGAGAATTNNAVTGDVIGVSITGTKAVLSDSSTTPNQVFLYDQPSNAGTQLFLTPTDHAKSAVFSPDAFLVYITTYQCTAAPCQTSNEVAGPVYVYDAFNGLRRLATPTGVTDVAFHPSGALVYMAQASNAVTAVNTSNNSIAASPNGTQTIALPGSPEFLRALTDWDDTAYTTHFIAFNGPNAGDAEIIGAATPKPLPDPCTLSGAITLFSVCNSLDAHIDFGQGPLDVSQFLVSANSETAYVIPHNFGSVFAYNLPGQIKTGISLTGGQPATTGGLTTDGAFLYVGSTDGLVHFLNAAFSSDTLDIQPLSSTTSPPTALCSISTATQPCNPDFVLVKP